MRPLYERYNVKNERLSKIKPKIKENAPKIIGATLLIASTTCAIILKQKLDEERRRFPEGGSTKLAVNECCFEELKKGEPLIWIKKGHLIDVMYDPNC